MERLVIVLDPRETEDGYEATDVHGRRIAIEFYYWLGHLKKMDDNIYLGYAKKRPLRPGVRLYVPEYLGEI